MVVADDDNNSAAAVAVYFGKLKALGIPAEVHICARGGHWYGMTGRTPTFRDLSLSHWPDQLQAWLVDRGFLPR